MSDQFNWTLKVDEVASFEGHDDRMILEYLYHFIGRRDEGKAFARWYADNAGRSPGDWTQVPKDNK